MRDYQKDAIKSLSDNSWKGIFDMATGTGKTLTSIFSTISYREEKGRIFRIILVPYLHLIPQWKEELQEIGINSIIECSSNNYKWEMDLNKQIQRFNQNYTKEAGIIAVYDTSKTDKFKQLIERIDKDIFLIADECHYLGTDTIDLSIYNNVEARLGLSATPTRWWDEKGSKKIQKFFSKTVYSYTLEKAIYNEFLVEYKYNPILINLNDSEIEKYSKLTRRISILIDMDKVDSQEFLHASLMRQEIINNAQDKENKLYSMLSDFNEVKNTLVYCDGKNIDRITKNLSKLGYKVRRFNYLLKSKEREEVLDQFENGDIDILTAIKCLDEGVDIPNVSTAFFICSTSNPREFIQRRGRILRKHKNKDMAKIYDFIVLAEDAPNNIFESIARSEMPRFAEFTKYAINSSACRLSFREILKPYYMEDLVNKLPWEMYFENKRRYEVVK